MERLIFFVLVPLILATFSPAESKNCTSEWRRSLGLGQEQLTHLHFFFHDTVSGKTPSAVQVASAATTKQSPTNFGVVMMADDPLTAGPEPSSMLLGRAQGLYGSAGQGSFSLIMALSYTFTDGPYRGSSFSLMGRNPALETVREMPIVGGTGAFRFSRGVAIAKTYSLNTNGDAVVEYNVTIVH